MPSVSALSIDIWECIAYYALIGDDAFFGPPSGLSDLCLISRHVYNAIRFDNNSRLYARLFRFKFDYAAPCRRLSIRWRNTRCLALEFKKRVATLKRVRCRQELEKDDLWTCYLMMLENDGRNERHLVEWARLYQYLHKFTIIRFVASRADPSSWFNDSEVTALTLWLWWMIFFPGALRKESNSTRDALSAGLLPELIYAGYLHPSIYAPDAHFDLPLPPDLEYAAASCSGPPPSTKQVIHYGNALTLAAPLLTPAALLVWIVRMQLYLDDEPFNPTTINLPPDRQTADTLSYRTPAPTVEDILEFRSIRIRAPERCPLHIDLGENDLFEVEDVEEETNERWSQGSRRYDSDWYRLVSCHDPWADNPSLRGPVYRIGSLSGSWGGRFTQTNFDTHMSILRNPQSYHERPAHLYSQPLFWDLREHHCLHPDTGVDLGVDDLGGDDFLNAWLPRQCEVKQLEDAVELYHPMTRRTTRYETFYPQGTAGSPYSPDVCEKLRSNGILDRWEEVAEDEDGPNEGVLAQTEANEFVDVVTHRNSGIADILITGQTGEQHGAAWGHFDLIGRVRPWDGLVVLLRTPRNPAHSYLGKWVFRGYIHNENFVGRWREISTAPDLTGYEGGFVVCKTI